MTIPSGLDVHRRQITYDWVDADTGEGHRGQLAPATREHLRAWLDQFADRPAAFTLEGCTGRWYVVEDLTRAGIEAHLAEPADTSAARGPKRRANTDQKADARNLRELLATGRLSESWLPLAHGLRRAPTGRYCTSAPPGSDCARPSTHGVPDDREQLAASGAPGWSGWNRASIEPWRVAP